jgi:hypothetical protein
MNVKFCAVALAAMSCALPQAAAADPAPVQSQNVRPQADPNQMICETETVVGSRLGAKKTCLTRSQWAERRKADREFVQDLQLGRQGVGCSAPEMGGGQRGLQSC